MEPRPSPDLDAPSSLKALASTRSLIINPTTSASTISSILETLTASLRRPQPPTHHRHLTKLLASCHPHHSPLPSLNDDDDEDGRLLFLSLCFGHDVPSRLRLLRNPQELGIRSSSLLLAAFLGFTKDPYPYVREAALNGLVGMCAIEDRSVVEGCYSRAVELLEDSEDCVRAAAVRAVSEWGRMLVAIADSEEGKRNWSDAVFLQLGVAVRDMCMSVRVEAFDALRKLPIVSEDILLQSLSKRVLQKIKEKKSCGPMKARYTILASSAAGAFLHGLEDEFSEVRKLACQSLQSLAVQSVEFANQALDLLVDMLNDDSIFVRSAALQALLHLTKYELLKIKDTHMHMLLSTLLDKDSLIRVASHKLFKFMKLPSPELFRMTIYSLLESLQIYPEDEAGVFSVLFLMGRNHRSFAAPFIEEVCTDMEPVTEENMGLSSLKVAAFLVLAISVPLSPELRNCRSIPPHLFSYAVTLLGRISYALEDIMDQDTLLAFLSQCSRSPSLYGEEEILCTDLICPVGSTVDSNVSIDSIASQSGEASEVQFSKSDMVNSSVIHHLDEHGEDKDLVNGIFAKVAMIWPMIQSGNANDVLKTLRVCKEELSMLFPECLQCQGLYKFALHFLEVMELIAKVSQLVWCQALPHKVGSLDILLGKLDESLRDIRCSFIGLSEAEELHICELMLLICMLRLSKGEISSSAAISQKLTSIVSYLELVQQRGCVKLSNFAIEVKNFLEQHDMNGSGLFCCSFTVQKLLSLLSHQQFYVPRRLRHVHVELDVCGNNSENPLPFVPGLPMAVPLEVTLYEVMNYNRLWLRIRMSAESVQFVFLDHNVLGAFKQIKKLPFVACFYRTPKAVSFTLRVSVGMECQFEDSTIVDDVYGGPDHPLVYLCHEEELHVRVHEKI